MKGLQEIQSIGKLKIEVTGVDGGCGHLFLNGVNAEPMVIVWSNGGGWEHVSVSYRRKTPTWDEMCRVKELFFNDDETVLQYHPCKSQERVHQHPSALSAFVAEVRRKRRTAAKDICVR